MIGSAALRKLKIKIDQSELRFQNVKRLGLDDNIGDSLETVQQSLTSDRPYLQELYSGNGWCQSESTQNLAHCVSDTP